MTDTTFKSVFTFDPDTQTYKPFAHNASADQAVEHLNTQAEAKIRDQEKRHRNPDPLKCQACKRAAQELSAQHEQAGGGTEQSDEERVAQESESD